MPYFRSTAVLRRFRIVAPVVAALAALAVNAGARATAEEGSAYTVEVSDVTAKVGENTVVHAKLTPREGFKILHSYNNRVGQLSSFDDGVAFERKVVPAADEDGVLVFDISVRPTRPGSHAINGVFRVGYVQTGEGLSMISVPLIANVVGKD